MLRHVPHFVWGIVLSFATPVLAQNGALGELYGHGVHAYNSGEYVQAYDLLTRAIESGSTDPRCYYFRGLSYLKLGREPEAKTDFSAAAELEMADSDRFYNVSKSLERIQGRSRKLLEQYRSEARLRAYQDREDKRRRRYDKIRRNEPNVTERGPAEQVPAVETDEAPVLPDEMPADGDAPADMPADGPNAESADEPTVDGTEEMPAEEPKAEEDDPFGDAAKPEEETPTEEPAADGDAPKGDDDDPFAEEAKPEDEMPAEEPAADGDEPKSDDDDPFAEEAKPNDGAKPQDDPKP